MEPVSISGGPGGDDDASLQSCPLPPGKAAHQGTAVCRFTYHPVEVNQKTVWSDPKWMGENETVRKRTRGDGRAGEREGREGDDGETGG